jgi:chromosome segregation ATPase
MSTSTIEAVRAAAAADEQQRETDFCQLVEAVADEKLTADEVSERLAATGRTVDELVTAVDLKGRRREWARQMADGESAAKEMPSVHKAIETTKADYEKSRLATLAELQRRLKELDAEARALNRRIATGQQARNQLLNTADLALVQAVGEARKRNHRYGDPTGPAARMANQLDHARHSRARLLKEAPAGSHAKGLHTQRLEQLDQEIGQLEAQLAHRREHLDGVAADIEQLDAERLRP